MSLPRANAGRAPKLRARFAGLASKQWLLCVLIGVAGFVVHLPALQGELIWDDAYLIRQNPFIKSPLLGLEAFRHYLFLDSYSGHYRPFQNISLMVDYYFWNTDAIGFHLTNILLHITAGLLLYRLLVVLMGSRRDEYKSGANESAGVSHAAPFLVALIWTVHPVHSAAVDYISGRADSLAFACSAGAWLLVLRGRVRKTHGQKLSCYLLAGLLGILALCAREIAAIWCLIFLAHTFFWTEGLRGRAKLTAAACCAIILAGYAGLRHLPAARPTHGSFDNWSAPVRATLMLRALGDYGRLMLWPANLHMERTVFEPRSYISNVTWRASAGSEYLTIFGFLIAIGLVYGCLRRGIGQRLRILGSVWFLAGYLPVSNIVQLNATVAEHWLYLPSVGLLLFLVGCVLELDPKFYRPLATAAVVAVVPLGVRTVVRSSDWHDDETFFKRTLAAGGDSARMGVNLGLAHSRRGDFAQAEKVLRRTVQLAPDYPVARNNLAYVLSRENKTAEAEAVFANLAHDAAREASEYPRTWMGIYNLACMRHNAGDDAGAISILERGRADYPEVWELISIESEILRKTQGPAAALHLIDQFVDRNWWHHAARLAQGKLYAENNDTVRSTEALRYAALLDIHDTQALNLLTRIYLRQNRLADAYEAQHRAVARQPDKPTEYTLLSEVLDKMGRTTEANRVRAKVSRLQALVLAQTGMMP